MSRKAHRSPTRIDAYLERLAGIVKEHGWAIQAVHAHTLCAYTVGLSLKNLPEVLMMGVDQDTAVSLLNSVARGLCAGTLTLEEGRDYAEVFESFPARFRKIPASQAHASLRMASVFCPPEQPLEAWQLLWPDPQGHFPGDPLHAQEYVPLQDLESFIDEAGAPVH
jgi:hypothetical protein